MYRKSKIVALLVGAIVVATAGTGYSAQRRVRVSERTETYVVTESGARSQDGPSPEEALRDVAAFPGRAVHSVVRTPEIIGGTLRGNRTLLNPMPVWRQEQLAEGRE